MRPFSFILRTASAESPSTLVREALWQLHKRWKMWRVAALLRNESADSPLRHVGDFSIYAYATEPERRQILEAADLICSGRIPLLSYGTVAPGNPTRWNRDWVADSDWPMTRSSRVRAVRFDGSDPKAPWELSRLQCLPILGHAYKLTALDRYRETALDIAVQWIESNPPGTGIHWKVAMEAALRAVSILLMTQQVWPMRQEEAVAWKTIRRSLREHLIFIEGHLEFSHLVRGNHYFSNLVGLFALSVCLDGKDMPQRRAGYRRLLEMEIVHQTRGDGGGFESSTGYHVLLTQMSTTAFLLMRAEGIEFPSFSARLRQMYRWMRTMADDEGRLPQIGDCDDGRIEQLPEDLHQATDFPPEQRDSLRVGGLLHIGALLWPEDPSIASTGSQAVQLLAESGVAVGRVGDAQFYFVNMPNGAHGRGAHTHNDKLSLLVRIAGEDLLCDSGTGFYTRNRPARQQLRATAAHNTLRVDKAEQNGISDRKEGIFTMGNQAHVTPIRSDMADGVVRLTASHFGYRRHPGIIHQRTVTWNQAGSIPALQVDDNVISDVHNGSSHLLELTYILGGAWQVEGITVQGQVTICRIRGPRPAELSFCAPFPLDVQKEPASLSQLFGCVRQTEKIMVRARTALPATVTTTVRWGFGVPS